MLKYILMKLKEFGFVEETATGYVYHENNSEELFIGAKQ
jgi:hypothetical protein